MTVKRYDVGTLDAAQELPNGFLRVPARLTRTGVFPYRNPDGSQRRELRLPEEVFAKESLDSFAAMPFTNDHPAEGRVNASNATKYTKGYTGESIVQDGDHVAGAITVMDKFTIDAMRNGKRQISCGYDCDLEMKPGTYDGQPYDAIQRNIRGNHVALVSVGRAGPSAAVRLDAGDAVMLAPEIAAKPELGVRQMAFLRIDGVPFECPDQTAVAVEKALAESKAHADASDKAALDAKAAADVARAEVQSVKVDLAAATKRADALEASLGERVTKRVALVTEAAKHLDSATPEALAKLHAMDERAIHAAVVSKLDGLTIDAAESNDFARALYVSAIARAAKAPLDNARRLVADVAVQPASQRVDAKEARRLHIEHVHAAASGPIDGAVSRS